MINLDPSLLDQDKTRKEKRKYLLRLYLIPITLFLVIALFFLSTWFYNFIYFISYSNNNFPIARDLTETRFLINILEPYIPNYNQGIAHMRMGEFKKAEESFQKSVEHNPPEDKICKVYENYSLSVEKQADERRAGGQYGESVQLYYYAEALLYNHGCAGKNGADGRSYNADAAASRVIDSRNDAISEMNNSYDENDTSIEKAREKEVTDEDLNESKKYKVDPNNAQGMSDMYKRGEGYKCNVAEGDLCW
ncbi:tetratricopeptide repeat protein [Candidatus Saccharibacteria bacterium]|nr:tetratricopeptide repeat protein [Candidatus Saccharibacteria bacterium]